MTPKWVHASSKETTAALESPLLDLKISHCACSLLLFWKKILRRERKVCKFLYIKYRHMGPVPMYIWRSENHFQFGFSFDAIFEMESLVFAVGFTVGWTVSIQWLVLAVGFTTGWTVSFQWLVFAVRFTIASHGSPVPHLPSCHRNTESIDICGFWDYELWFSWLRGNCGIHYPPPYSYFLMWGCNWQQDWDI